MRIAPAFISGKDNELLMLCILKKALYEKSPALTANPHAILGGPTPDHERFRNGSSHEFHSLPESAESFETLKTQMNVHGQNCDVEALTTSRLSCWINNKVLPNQNK